MKKVLKKSLMFFLCFFSFSLFAETLSDDPETNPSFNLKLSVLNEADGYNSYYEQYYFKVILDKNGRVGTVTNNNETVSFSATYSPHGILERIKFETTFGVYEEEIQTINGYYSQANPYPGLKALGKQRHIW